jgi:flagellar hook-length control protein FliK
LALSGTPGVGFAPVSAAVATAGAKAAGIGAGLHSPAGAEEGGGLDGLFAALLALLDAAGVDPAGIDTAHSTSAELTGATAGIFSTTTAGRTSAIENDGSQPAPNSLVQELTDALSAVEQSVGSGTPLSPALRKKLDETIDALAGLLGISLPAVPAATAAITNAGAGIVPPADAAGAAPPAQPVLLADAAGDDGEATGVAGNLSAGDKPAPTPLSRLAARIEQLAATLTPSSPHLARKLEAVAQGLATPAAADLIEKLAPNGKLEPLERKLEAALSALGSRPAPQPAPQSPPFAPAALATPAELATPTASARGGLEPQADDAQGSGTKVAVGHNPATQAKPDGAGPGASPAASSGAAPSADAASAQPASAGDPATGGNAALPAHQPGGTAPITGARIAQAAYQPPPPPYPQVAFEIARQFAAGNSRFQIRLDPPELGRIEVKLDVDKHGTVNARMTVDKAETLDLMQRDQRALERALAQAGLDAGKTSLQFSLRQNPSGNGGGRQQADFGSPQPTAPLSGSAAEAAPLTHYRATATLGGVNLFV